MTTHITTHQPLILRIISEQGMEGRCSPLDPHDPGAVCIFPDQATDMNTTGTYYIVMNRSSNFTMLRLQNTTLDEAMACFEDFIRQNVEHHGEPRISLLGRPSSRGNQNN